MSGERTDRLVDMANDIAGFFRSQPSRQEAVKGVANHIRSFWTARMRAQIAEHLVRGGEGLESLSKEALELLQHAPADARPPPPGGDAG